MAKLISLDIETYGSCQHDAMGNPLPTQKETRDNGRFHPDKSLFLDKPATLVLSAAVTFPETEPPLPTLKTLCEIRPGNTCVFLLHDPEQLRILTSILADAEIIVGHNLLFDITYLRRVPGICRVLHTQTLIDTVIVSNLENEAQDERTLKDLGPLFGAYRYDRTLTSGRFSSPLDPDFIHYNAEDTHNTLLLLQALALSIRHQYPETDKLSPYCINYYSNLLWVCVRMLEDGIPFNRQMLVDKDLALAVKCSRAAAVCLNHGLQIAGPGCQATQKALTQTIIKELSSCGIDILQHPQLARTEKKQEISFSNENLTLFSQHLPKTHPLQRPLRAAIIHNKAQKLRSAYTVPLLYHKRAQPNNKASALTPQPLSPHYRLPPPDLSTYSVGSSYSSSPFSSSRNPTTDIWIAYPSWYPVPSRFSDSDDAQGGTIQARITCKKPGIQTNPGFIKECIASRYGSRGLIVVYDLSQIELRVAALLSGDPVLVHNYQDGLDLHTDRALEVFTIPTLLELCSISETPKAWTDLPAFYPYRQAAKQLNFADLFLSSPETMRHSVFVNVGLDLPLAFFEGVAKSRSTSRPGLWAWQQAEIASALRLGYRELPGVGISRQYVGDIRGKEKHTVVNFPIQATAAAVQIEIQAEIHRNLESLRTLRRSRRTTHQVYDSSFFDILKTDLPAWKDLVVTSVTTVATTGLWARLQDRTGNTVPLEFQFSIPKG